MQYGFRQDASPKLKREISALQIESFPLGDPTGYQRVWAPGSTLAHGAASTTHKIYLFIWGLFLMFGPTVKQLRSFLADVQFAVTDAGGEMGIADSLDVLPAWFHWVRKLPGDPPVPDGSSYLMPNCVKVSGWGHMFGNVVHRAAASLPRWPVIQKHLHTIVRFLREEEYRFAWADFAERYGSLEDAEKLRAPFLGSFVQTRWESILVAFVEVDRVASAFHRSFDVALFSSVKDAALVREVQAIKHNKWFWAFVQEFSGVSSILLEALFWGFGCACHNNSDNKKTRLCFQVPPHAPSAPIQDRGAATFRSLAEPIN